MNDETKDNIATFVADLHERDKSPATMAKYEAGLRAFAAWLGADGLDPTTITTQQAQDYRQHLLDRGHQPATINGHMAALRAFGRWAEKQGHPNFARYLKDLRLDPYRPRALERKDLLRLLRAVREHGSVRDQALVYLLVQAGLRAAEAAALQVGDLELGERKGSVQVRSGKGRRVRQVPLPAEARAALKAYLDGREDLGATDPLFPAQRGLTAGQPVQPRAVWDVVKKYARLADLKGVTPHILRHTYATATLETSGHDLRLVQHLLGHSRIETTARYLKPSPKAAEAAANGLSDWLVEDADQLDQKV